MQNELKPCPFCGSTKVKLDAYKQYTYLQEYHVIYGVDCYTCGGKTGSFCSIFAIDDDKNLVCTKDGKSMAIDAWNRRTNT